MSQKLFWLILLGFWIENLPSLPIEYSLPFPFKQNIITENAFSCYSYILITKSMFNVALSRA